MEAKVYNKKGTEAGKVKLPEKVFSAEWNADLVHQVVESMRSNKRAGTAHAKDRSDVSGGGKKPWKQKGTGRARHGSTRSPIWVGGGKAHGPLSIKNYKRDITKKSRARALFSVLSKKLADGEVIFIDNLATDAPKTKDAVEVMENLATATGYNELATSPKPRALVALFERNENSEKSYRNLPQLDIVFAKNLNPVDVLNHKYLILERPEDTVGFLASRG